MKHITRFSGPSIEYILITGICFVTELDAAFAVSVFIMNSLPEVCILSQNTTYVHKR